MREIPRQPGQKESRWTHTLAGVEAGFSPPLPAEAGTYTERLVEELRAFKAKLGE